MRFGAPAVVQAAVLSASPERSHALHINFNFANCTKDQIPGVGCCCLGSVVCFGFETRAHPLPQCLLSYTSNVQVSEVTEGSPNRLWWPVPVVT